MAIVAGMFSTSLFFTGCAVGTTPFVEPQTPVKPPPGFLVEFNQYPLYIEQEPKANPISSQSELAVGSAEANRLIIWSAFLSFGWGDASIEAATADGNIKELHYGDIDNLNILGLFRRTTVVAYGTR